MSDKETQKDELCALESIYNSEELRVNEENGKSGGQFFAHVNLPQDFKVTFRDLRVRGKSVYEDMAVGFLPPLVLYFSLPEDYPSRSPPNFTLSCQWLRRDNIAKLCRRLDYIWQENKGMEILYLWTEFLKEESLKFLNINEKLDISTLHTYYLCYVDQLKRRHTPQLAEIQEDSSKGSRAVSETKNKKTPLGVSKGPVNAGEGTACNGVKPNEGQNARTSRGRGSRYNERQNSHTEEDFVGDSKENVIQKQRHQRSVQKDERAVLDLSPEVSLLRLLQDFNESQKKAVFSRNFYSCKVCFQDKRGEQCTQFEPCGHVFCKDCISSYLEVRIKDGAVQGISCPEDNCTSEALPSQVRELVSDELFAKYDAVLLSATLDTMEDILYCPRSSCNYPVSREPNEKMATCPACHYVFCIYCKMVYHGVEPCRFKSVEKQQLATEYQNALPERRAELEQRYGKKQLQTLVDTTMSEAWINDNSKNCPHCNAAIEKSDGCNKMVCWRCNTFFCWICQARLNPQCPYQHFSTASSQCFNKLFLGVPLDDDDGMYEVIGDDD